MGYEGTIGRRKFVDVRIVRSKTGLAILKGGSFYNLSLSTRLRQISKDAFDEINSINYQMRLMCIRSARRMKKSEELVKTFDLPPLKSKQVDHTASSKKEEKKNSEVSSVTKSDVKKTNNQLLSRRHDMRSVSPGTCTEGRDLRKMVYSPAPAPYKERYFDNECDNETVSLTDDHANSYPHIKVEKCDTKLPPVHKRQPSPPEYAKQKPERSFSSNSLEIPSPMQKRRNEDGKCLTVLTPSLNSNFSHSESSLIDVKENSETDDKGNTSIMKALPITCGKTRPSARSQGNNQLTAKRTVSRSLSPRPRLTNRTQATPTFVIQGSSNP